mgnify:FL=1
MERYRSSIIDKRAWTEIIPTEILLVIFQLIVNTSDNKLTALVKLAYY